MRRFFAGLLLVVCSGVTACSTDSREPAEVAALTAQERSDLTQASMGTFEASLVLAVVLLSPSLSCPMVTVTSTTMTVNGGCTDTDGVRWSGRISATAGSTSLSIDLDSFAIEEDGSRLAVDGRIDVSDSRLASDLELSLDQRTLSIDATWTEGRSGGLALGSGSSVGLDDKGYLSASGQWDLEVPSGAIDLTGQGTLHVDFTTYSDGCARATLDGAATADVCVEAGLGVRPSTLDFARAQLAKLPRR
jgi:hypothetical protein